MGVAAIAEELPHLVRFAATSEPAKSVAKKSGLSVRQVYYLRQREGDIGFLTFCALAQGNAELRAALGRWFNMGDKTTTEAEKALALLRKLAANMPDEGDQA